MYMFTDRYTDRQTEDRHEYPDRSTACDRAHPFNRNEAHFYESYMHTTLSCVLIVVYTPTLHTQQHHASYNHLYIHAHGHVHTYKHTHQPPADVSNAAF